MTLSGPSSPGENPTFSLAYVTNNSTALYRTAIVVHNQAHFWRGDASFRMTKPFLTGIGYPLRQYKSLICKLISGYSGRRVGLYCSFNEWLHKTALLGGQCCLFAVYLVLPAVHVMTQSSCSTESSTNEYN